MKIEYVEQPDLEITPIVPLGVYRKGDDLFILVDDDSDPADKPYMLIALNRVSDREHNEATWLDEDELRNVLDDDGYKYVPNAVLTVPKEAK